MDRLQELERLREFVKSETEDTTLRMFGNRWLLWRNSLMEGDSVYAPIFFLKYEGDSPVDLEEAWTITLEKWAITVELSETGVSYQNGGPDTCGLCLLYALKCLECPLGRGEKDGCDAPGHPYNRYWLMSKQPKLMLGYLRWMAPRHLLIYSVTTTTPSRVVRRYQKLAEQQDEG